MIARAHVALGGALLTATEKAAGGLEPLERDELVGEVPDTGDIRADWERAKAAAAVPADALVLYWIREP